LPEGDVVHDSDKSCREKVNVRLVIARSEATSKQ